MDVVDGERRTSDADLATPTSRTQSRWADWKSITVVIAVMLGLVGALNLDLQTRASEASATGASAVALRGLLQEESNLQWRVLAEQGPALEVARGMGELRRQEYEVRDDLLAGGVSPSEELVTAMSAYHETIDRELGLLAVGRLDEALEYEREQTMPLFQRLDDLLVAVAADAAATAQTLRGLATTTLLSVLTAVLMMLGLLLRRAQAAHAEARDAIALMLEQERAASASLEQAKAMVHHQATHDPLTSLPNRLGLRENLRSLVDRVDTQLCVVFIDLDGFKSVNDANGHEHGDRVLCNVADALRSGLRAGELAARMGGDEFVVIAEVPDAAAGAAVAQRLRARIGATCADNDTTGVLGVSLGVAIGPSADIRTLLDDADQAMYREKRRRSGREASVRSPSGRAEPPAMASSGAARPTSSVPDSHP